MTAPGPYLDPAHVAAILRDLCEAAGGRDLATVVPPLCRAAGAVYAQFERRPALPAQDRHALLLLWRSAEDAARAVLPPAYCEGRGAQGFAAAFGLLFGSGGATGSTEGALTDPDIRVLALTLRVFVNDLDSICTACTLAQSDPTASPLAVLLGVPYSPEVEPSPRPPDTVH